MCEALRELMKEEIEEELKKNHEQGIEQGRINQLIDLVMQNLLPIETAAQCAKMTLDEFKAQSELFDKDIFEDISLEHSVGARKSYGGTAPEAVKVQMQHAEEFLDKAHKDLE